MTFQFQTPEDLEREPLKKWAWATVEKSGWCFVVPSEPSRDAQLMAFGGDMGGYEWILPEGRSGNGFRITGEWKEPEYVWYVENKVTDFKSDFLRSAEDAEELVASLRGITGDLYRIVRIPLGEPEVVEGGSGGDITGGEMG